MKTFWKLLQFLLFTAAFAPFAFSQGTATATLKEAYIPLPGGGKAIYESNGTLTNLTGYQRSDGSGNVRIISGSSQSFVPSSVEIAPFGEDFDDNLPTGLFDFSFNQMGQEDGTAGGVSKGYGALYITPNREYSAVQGRWLSPDPFMGENGYVYADNNPIVNSDPSGLQDGGDDCNDDECVSWGWDGGGDGWGTYWVWGADGGWWSMYGWGWNDGIWVSAGGRVVSLKSLYSSAIKAGQSAAKNVATQVLNGPRQSLTPRVFFLNPAISPATLDFAFDVDQHGAVNAVNNYLNAHPIKVLFQAWTLGLGLGLSVGVGDEFTPAGISSPGAVDPYIFKGPAPPRTFVQANWLSENALQREMGWPSKLGEAGFDGRTERAYNARLGFSKYGEFLDRAGYQRTSDHWSIPGSGSTVPALQGVELIPGGQLVPAGAGVTPTMYVFDHPVTGWYFYAKPGNLTPSP